MIFELGKSYIVNVTENGIIPFTEFDRSLWFNKDYDDLEFLTDEEKEVIINEAYDQIRAEIEKKIEQERFARSVFRCEEKDAVKAEQCTGSIFAYNNVIKLIDEYKAESDG